MKQKRSIAGQNHFLLVISESPRRIGGKAINVKMYGFILPEVR